jgi:hypothetical protein
MRSSPTIALRHKEVTTMTQLGGWDATQVRLGTTGNIWRAPALTAAPADAATAPATPWVNLGYASDDGFAITPKVDTTDIMVWQSQYPVRSKVMQSIEIKSKLVQDDPEIWQLAFGGGSVDGTTGTYTPPAPGEVYENAFLFDVIDGADLIRYWFARGIVTDVADVIHKADEAIGYEITVKVLGVGTGSPWQRMVNPAPTLLGASTTAPVAERSSAAA